MAGRRGRWQGGGGPNSVTGALGEKGKGEERKRREDPHGMTEPETGMSCLQAEDCRQAPEAGEAGGTPPHPLEPPEGEQRRPAPTPDLGIWPQSGDRVPFCRRHRLAERCFGPPQGESHGPCSVGSCGVGPLKGRWTVEPSESAGATGNPRAVAGHQTPE